MSNIKSETKMVTLSNEKINMFIVLLWNEAKYKPSSLDITDPNAFGKSYPSCLMEKLFTIHHDDIKNRSENDLALEQLALVRLSFKRYVGRNHAKGDVTHKSIVKDFSYSDVTVIADASQMKNQVIDVVNEFKTKGLNCAGVFLNHRSDLKEMYLHTFFKEEELPVIKTVSRNGELSIEKFNILLIKDTLLNTCMAFPWEIENIPCHHEQMVSGNFLAFKRWLLVFAGKTFTAMGTEKNAIKKQWCDQRFLKLLCNNVEGLEIENITFPNAIKLVDCADEYLNIINTEGAEKFINYPNFRTNNKVTDEIFQKLRGTTVIFGYDDKLSKLLSVKRFTDLSFEMDEDGDVKDFSNVNNECFVREANSNSVDGRTREAAY